jgi:hypothetical protein
MRARRDEQRRFCCNITAVELKVSREFVVSQRRDLEVAVRSACARARPSTWILIVGPPFDRREMRPWLLRGLAPRPKTHPLRRACMMQAQGRAPPVLVLAAPAGRLQRSAPAVADAALRPANASALRLE